MHVYIYDSFLSHNKFSKILSRIETRITDLGLNGKIARLGPMKNVEDLVKSELKRGAKTVVAVGDDKTVDQVVSSMAHSGVPLGIIPIDKKDNHIAASLGITDIEEACNILSARRIETIDLGRINNNFFLSFISLPGKNILFDIAGTYSIELTGQGTICLVNLKTADLELPSEVAINPQDGMLQMVTKASATKKYILGNKQSDSVFAFKKLKISNQGNSILTEQGLSIFLPAEVEVAPSALKVIVGKNRFF